jgi:hypothetical protein
MQLRRADDTKHNRPRFSGVSCRDRILLGFRPLQSMPDEPHHKCHPEPLMFSASFLFASLIWGSIGVGYFIYGKKQQSLPAMVGGIVMVGVSYLVGSALLMSLISILVIVAVYNLARRGY